MNREHQPIAHEGEVPEADELGREAAVAEERAEPERALALLDQARRLRGDELGCRAATAAEWKTHEAAHARGEFDIVEVRRGQATEDSEEAWLIVGVADKEIAGKRIVVWDFNDEGCARAVAATLNAMVLADAMSAAVASGAGT